MILKAIALRRACQKKWTAEKNDECHPSNFLVATRTENSENDSLLESCVECKALSRKFCFEL